jgi:protein O-mannosyl-transferase
MGKPFEQTRAAAPAVLAGILAVITLVLWFPPRDAEFVYDARYQILYDSFLHDPSNLPEVLTLRVLARDVLDFNRPVQIASLMLDAALWGKEAFGYRLTSAVLHTITTVLLFTVLLRWLAAPGRTHPFRKRAAFAAALLYAVHPVLAEAICEPACREDLLVAFFCVLALLCALVYDPKRPVTALALAGCPVAALLGVGSKETGVVIPFVLLACWATSRRGEPVGPWLAALIPAFLATAGFLFARFALETPDSQIFTEKPGYVGGSLSSALMLQPRILTLYAANVLCPAGLCADYGIHSLRFFPMPLALAVLAVLIGGGIWLVLRDPRALVPATLIAGALLPVMNLIPIYRPAADRYLTLPMVGIAMIAALLLDRWLAVKGSRRFLPTALVLAVVVAAFMVVNAGRQRVWNTSPALWEDTLRRNPRSVTAASGLGSARMRAGQLAGAEAAFARALALSNGQRADVWAEVAVLMSRQGRQEDALQALHHAIERDAQFANPAQLAEALRVSPDSAVELQKLLDLSRRRAQPRVKEAPAGSQ